MTKIERTPSRIRTRFIAVLALITSGITFGSGFIVFLYMKSPAFENQLTGQVLKNMDWIIANEFEKKIKQLKPRPVVDVNDPNKWFWDYIERRQREQVEEQILKFK
tara:strand:- start:66 stop:383 length:318 start_codon:yes stop_codon:yes gene_type:complete